MRRRAAPPVKWVDGADSRADEERLLHPSVKPSAGMAEVPCGKHPLPPLSSQAGGPFRAMAFRDSRRPWSAFLERCRQSGQGRRRLSRPPLVFRRRLGYTGSGNLPAAGKRRRQRVMGTMADKGKTNAMRILDRLGVAYTAHEYDHADGKIDGVAVAQKMGQPLERVFKTLVTQGAGRDYFVFVIPVAKELDLKAAARAVGQKAVAMIPVADINRVTGYIRGGCSPIGMKKAYATVVDASCRQVETMIVSAGKIGHQIELRPQDLVAAAGAAVAPIAAD